VLVWPPSEPDPATVAPGGIGNDEGQLGGSLPSREIETCPSSVATSKLRALVVVVVAGVLLSELEHPAVTIATATNEAIAAEQIVVRRTADLLVAVLRVLSSGTCLPGT
jgi:hypothetical protein